MALLKYLQCNDNLPNPKGSLSFKVAAAAIIRADQKVQTVSEMDTQVKEMRKRGVYHRYSTRDKSATGRHASQHDVAAATRLFS